MSALLAPALASDVIPMPDERFGGLGPVQVVALVLCTIVPLIGWALLFRQVGRFVALYRLGRPDTTRTDSPAARSWTLTKEFLGHTRMSRIKVVAVAHWFTALAFMILFTTLVNAFFQLVQPDYRLPLIGHFPPFEWVVELFAWAGLVGIVVLMLVRQREHPRSAAGEGGRRSRFFGSTFWQAYYVELTILFVTICIVLLRGLESALVQRLEPETSLALHFPLTGWMAGLWSGSSVAGLATWVYVVATVKILISFAWMITIALQPTMGVAWHRFLAFPNIWFKREASGRTALGAVRPLTVGGEPFTLEALEEMEEGDSLGVGAVEDFTWKGLLDFSTCTECGRCQSQCPAWNTEKPLSPKLLMMALRDHADAKAPYLTALAEHDGDSSKALASVAAKQAAPDAVRGVDGAPSAVDWSQMSLVGNTGYDIASPLTAYNPHGPDAVIDADVLWSCTTCGACVEQCPVDIEHVDHIVDMRRYATLIESAFPAELGGLFKNLEGKGNPWGMGARARLDWAKDLPFPVKVLGQDVEKASEVEWLFWVGCAGAYEDRAKKTTRAVAELLDSAGVSFAVLGDGETCTGDSARRAGNELLFQTLAAQNVSTFGEFGVTKVVVTCAHCFNTIKNEYPSVGGSYEVVHHTQLLNRLVREKKLVPVARPSDTPGMSTARNAASTASTVTYHDPCYLGRHNGVYAPPRELIGALPGVELREMPRTKEKSFCCGAGGARMWMEEKLGTRINTNRTEEAVATGAERIAIGCPFCRVMISDGLTAKQAAGEAEEVEVVDVAQMLLAAVRRAPDGAEAAVVEEVRRGRGRAVHACPCRCHRDRCSGARRRGRGTGRPGRRARRRPVGRHPDRRRPGTLHRRAPPPTTPTPGTTPPPRPLHRRPPRRTRRRPPRPPSPTATRGTTPPPPPPPRHPPPPSPPPMTPTPGTRRPPRPPLLRPRRTSTHRGPSRTRGTSPLPSTTRPRDAPRASRRPRRPRRTPPPRPMTSTHGTSQPHRHRRRHAGAGHPEIAAASTDDVDPWDEPADTATPAPVAAPTEEPASDEDADRTRSDQLVESGPADVEEQAAPEPTAPEPAAVATDDVDPWDEPADTATPALVAAPTEEPASDEDADRTQSDQLVESGTAEVEQPATPEPADVVTDDVDPWDEPTDTATPAPVAAPTEEPAADKDADRTQSDLSVESGTADVEQPATPEPADVVTDDVDPWDEPADTATPAPVAAPTEEPAADEDADRTQSDLSVDSGTAEVDGSADAEAATEAESQAQSEGTEEKPDPGASGAFTGDPKLLDEPDPWD